MELRKKLKLVEFSKRILEKKRDSLQSAIKTAMETMREVIKFLKRSLIELFEYAISVAISYGPRMRTYALAQRERLEIVVHWIAERGIVVPVLEVVKKPRIPDSFPEGIRDLANRVLSSLGDIMKLSGILLKLEVLLRELEVTNRIVNTLDKVIIPDLKEKVSYITTMLSEFFISELSSLRVLLSGSAEV